MQLGICGEGDVLFLNGAVYKYSFLLVNIPDQTVPLIPEYSVPEIPD
jgi:hypothetical protein